jgi:hypothetical protein
MKTKMLYFCIGLAVGGISVAAAWYSRVRGEPVVLEYSPDFKEIAIAEFKSMDVCQKVKNDIIRINGTMIPTQTIAKFRPSTRFSHLAFALRSLVIIE